MRTTMRNNIMPGIEIIMMILHLMNGEIARVPVSLMLHQSCSDKVMEMTEDTKNYKGQEVWAYYCKTTKGKWIK